MNRVFILFLVLLPSCWAATFLHTTFYSGPDCTGSVAYYTFVRTGECVQDDIVSVIDSSHFSISSFTGGAGCSGSSTSTSNNVTGECYLNGEVGSVIYSLNDDASTPADPLSYSWSGFPSCSNQTIIFGGAYVPLFCHAEDDGTSFTYLPCNETTLSTRTFESSDCTGLYTEGSFNIAGTCSDSSTAVCLASSESTTSSSSTTSSPSTPSSTTSQNQSSTGSFILPSCVLVLVIAALL